MVGWAPGPTKKGIGMSDSYDSRRRLRSRDHPVEAGGERSGSLSFLKNPRTLKWAIKVGFCAYRVLRFVLRISEFFE